MKDNQRQWQQEIQQEHQVDAQGHIPGSATLSNQFGILKNQLVIGLELIMDFVTK
jgi:hypothetical protein